MQPPRQPVTGFTLALGSLAYLIAELAEFAIGGAARWTLLLAMASFALLPLPLFGLLASGRIPWRIASVVGVSLYSLSFWYFALVKRSAIDNEITDYGAFASSISPWYAISGAAMVLGGLLLGWCLRRAHTSLAWAGDVFIAGNLAALVIGLAPVDPNWQTAANTLRNVALMAVGLHAARSHPRLTNGRPESTGNGLEESGRV